MPDHKPSLQQQPSPPQPDQMILELMHNIRDSVMHLLRPDQLHEPTPDDLWVGLQILKTAMDASFKLAEKERLVAETKSRLAEVEKLRVELEKIRE